MKKGKILLFTLLAGMLGFSAAYEVGRNIKYSDDNAVYDTPVIRDINHPDFVRAGDDEIPDVKVVELHYHNDNGGCGRDTTTPGTAGGRAFYIWTTGVGGVECMPDHVANDGQDMDITIDLTSEKFSKYAGKTALLFIIKFRMNSASDENWGGQSSDTELSYFEFPPDENGKVVACETRDYLTRFASLRGTKQSRQLSLFPGLLLFVRNDAKRPYIAAAKVRLFLIRKENRNQSSLKLMGNVYFTRTACPLCLPGNHFGIRPITRSASSSQP